MGRVDEFLFSEVTPQLMAGEQVMGMGCVRVPERFNLLGVPEKYEEWLATATNLRLILFKTENTGLFNPLTVNPKLMNRETRIWWYQELSDVWLGDVKGIGSGKFFTLVPHGPLGAYQGEHQRYDVFLDASGLDQHREFYVRFPAWLQAAVKSGAFPMDEQRRAFLAEHEERRRQAAERARVQAEERKQKAMAFLRAWREWVPFAVALAVLLPALAFAYLGAIEIEAVSSWERSAEAAERTLEDSKACHAGKKHDSFCKDARTEQAYARAIAEDRENAERSRILAPVYLGLTLLSLLGSASAAGFGLFRVRAASKRASAGVLPATAT